MDRICERKSGGAVMTALPEYDKPKSTKKGKKRVTFAIPESSNHQKEDDRRNQKWMKRPVEQRGRSSYVPDHVRHPEKYTCYTLDEPIIVGGGDDVATQGISEDSKPRIPKSSFNSSKSIEHKCGESEDRFLPEFGTGIEFRAQGNVSKERHHSIQLHKSEISPAVNVHIQDGDIHTETEVNKVINSMNIESTREEASHDCNLKREEAQFRRRTRRRQQYRQHKH